MSKVFISYSHDSPDHADKVLALSDRLIGDGVDCILDQYEESPPEGWPRWMDTNIKKPDFVLMICTETYYKRVMGEEEPGKGRGVRWEGNLIYQHFYDSDTMNRKFIPVLFESGKPEYIPVPLRGSTHYWVDREEQYQDLYRRLTGQLKTPKPKLGKIKKLPPRQRRQDFFAPQVTLSKLPTTRKELFGREKELETLDEAWADEHTNILSLVAWGGVGKTALVNHWLGNMEINNWRGAERVFDWSFYSQGAKEAGNASADTFFNEALKFFGFEGELPKNPWDKSSELLKLVHQQPTLLILDGLEPLQYPPGPMHKELHDKGMQAFLKNLSRYNNGLCIVTTRCAVKDIESTVGKSTKEIFLENLDEISGSALLKQLGVVGTEKELRATSLKFSGHALALNLLGSYLDTVHNGEVRRQDLVPSLYKDEENGSHARNVMESYEVWLNGKPELDILYLMGLFDRPAPGGAINELRKKPAIKGLTDKLQGLSEANWKFAVKRLRDLRLLGQRGENDPDKLDCHPLVREHFGEKLQKENPEGWREAHGRLYEYYKSLPEKLYGKFLPNTLEEMEPLFAAVAHGCQSGQHKITLDEIFWKRIDRGEAFIAHKLGALGTALSTISNFYDKPWDKLENKINERDKAYLLSITGFSLRALGRLREAAQPMKAGMEMRIKQEGWEGAAVNAGNLSELYLTLGDVKKAVDYAQKSVEYAEKSQELFVRFKYKSRFANSLFQVGKTQPAEREFREAEIIHRGFPPACDVMVSVEGFWFCDLLLSYRQFREVQKRATYSLKEWSTKQKMLLDIALDKLSLGRAYLIQTSLEKTNNYTQAADFLNQAVDGLRESGSQDDIPRGLLARAELFRYQQSYEKAWADLEETKEIAERGQMNLYIADYRLEAARVCLAEGNREAEGREHYEEAAKRVDNMGYHRRDPEILLIQAELELNEGNKKQAKETLKTAERRINEMGCHRWDREVERLRGLIDRRRNGDG